MAEWAQRPEAQHELLDKPGRVCRAELFLSHMKMKSRKIAQIRFFRGAVWALSIMLLMIVGGCTTLDELEAGSQNWDVTLCLRTGVQALPSDALANCLIRLVTKTDKTLDSEEKLRELGFNCATNLDVKRCKLVNRERIYGIGPFYTRGKDFRRRESTVALIAIDNKAVSLIVQERVSRSDSLETETVVSENLIY